MTHAALLLLAVCQAPVSAGVFVEPHVETLRYRFENPSRYDTEELVPHSFEQTYDTDNVWLGVRGSHPFFKKRGMFEAALTPSATRRADDFDTFHQPDGNLVVSGTTGNATVRSWRVSEHLFLTRGRSFSMALGYTYRHDHARFHEGDGITTTTRPPSIAHRLVTTREEPTSQLYALSWLAELTQPLGRRGSLALSVDVAPLARGRLTVVLPDKYPGQRLAYDAYVALAALAARYSWTAARWTLGGGVEGQRTFSWSRGDRLDLRGVSLKLDVERR